MCGICVRISRMVRSYVRIASIICYLVCGVQWIGSGHIETKALLVSFFRQPRVHGMIIPITCQVNWNFVKVCRITVLQWASLDMASNPESGPTPCPCRLGWIHWVHQPHRCKWFDGYKPVWFCSSPPPHSQLGSTRIVPPPTPPLCLDQYWVGLVSWGTPQLVKIYLDQ